MFMLDDRLSGSSFNIINLTLSEVRLKNNKYYPWVILIPRTESNVTEMFELSAKEQSDLMQEISHISRCMKKYFDADKINVGALGNIVSQLHIHVIARFKKDIAWPHSLWQENLIEDSYSIDEREKLIQQLRVVFS